MYDCMETIIRQWELNQHEISRVSKTGQSEKRICADLRKHGTVRTLKCVHVVLTLSVTMKHYCAVRNSVDIDFLFLKCL